MTNEQVATKLKQTFRSIQNHVNRGGSLNSIRGQQLVDRYNDLRRTAIHHNAPTWNLYCTDIQACCTHNGHDLFA